MDRFCLCSCHAAAQALHPAAHPCLLGGLATNKNRARHLLEALWCDVSSQSEMFSQQKGEDVEKDLEVERSPRADARRQPRCAAGGGERREGRSRRKQMRFRSNGEGCSAGEQQQLLAAWSRGGADLPHRSRPLPRAFPGAAAAMLSPCWCCRAAACSACATAGLEGPKRVGGRSPGAPGRGGGGSLCRACSHPPLTAPRERDLPRQPDGEV